MNEIIYAHRINDFIKQNKKPRRRKRENRIPFCIDMLFALQPNKNKKNLILVIPYQ